MPGELWDPRGSTSVGAASFGPQADGVGGAGLCAVVFQGVCAQSGGTFCHFIFTLSD